MEGGKNRTKIYEIDEVSDAKGVLFDLNDAEKSAEGALRTTPPEAKKFSVASKSGIIVKGHSENEAFLKKNWSKCNKKVPKKLKIKQGVKFKGNKTSENLCQKAPSYYPPNENEKSNVKNLVRNWENWEISRKCRQNMPNLTKNFEEKKQAVLGLKNTTPMKSRRGRPLKLSTNSPKIPLIRKSIADWEKKCKVDPETRSLQSMV